MNALRELTEEDKEQNNPYRVGALFTLSLDGVPVKWKAPYPINWILNQGEFDVANDECGGVSGSRTLSILNGYHVGPHFLWMMARQSGGDKATDMGVSNRDLADTMRKIGALRMEEEPFSFKDGRGVIQDPTKWPPLQPLKQKAAEQLASSVIWVKAEQDLDAFDAFRATITSLNKKYYKDHAAVFGLRWAYPMSQYIMDKPSETGSGHDVAVIGWDGDYAIIMQSYGTMAGNNGEQKLHRSIINMYAEKFGMFIPIDATRAEIDALIASGSKFDDPWRKNIVKRFVEAYLLFKKPFTWLVAVLEMFLNNRVAGPMLWDTPSHCRRNVRVMCDNMGVSWRMKNIICACIKQESGYLTKAVGPVNRNGTRDWGICQFNDGKLNGRALWIGQGATFKDTNEVLNDPEKCVRVMIRQALMGNIWYWSSYKTGAYLRWLPSESLPSTPY
jgi:hypothetical protein